MYFFDNKKHHRPPVHVQYGEDKAIIAIDDGEVLEGALPKPKIKLVEAWMEIHKDELLADWTLAVNGEQVFKIEPLK